ncbi:MAG TPA: DUF2905 family protein [Pyrinomonadaceae bacterium]|nr:DUF2905 family protein [Pyrinomonadaceae bacterium]
MFISGGLPLLPALTLVLLVVPLLFSRKLSWFGRLPGDIRYEGRRTRVYAPLASMLLLSLILSLALSLLSAFF